MPVYKREKQYQARLTCRKFVTFRIALEKEIPSPAITHPFIMDYHLRVSSCWIVKFFYSNFTSRYCNS